VAGFYENSNEYSSSINARNILTSLVTTFDKALSSFSHFIYKLCRLHLLLLPHSPPHFACKTRKIVLASQDGFYHMELVIKLVMP
jgi:hypothetical protein